MRKQFSPLMALAFFCFFSCAKTEQSAADQPPNNTPGGVDVSKENLVGSYRITKVEAGSGTQRSDVTEMWFDTYAGDCAKDDVTTFNPDESFVVQDGTVTCDESTDDTGTWKLLSNTQLKIDNDTATIDAFSATTLRIISPVYATPQGRIIFTYTRQ